MVKWSPSMKPMVNDIKQKCTTALAQHLAQLSDNPDGRLDALIGVVHELPGPQGREDLVYSACVFIANASVTGDSLTWHQLLRGACCPEADDTFIRTLNRATVDALKVELRSFHNRYLGVMQSQ